MGPARAKLIQSGRGRHGDLHHIARAVALVAPLFLLAAASAYTAPPSRSRAAGAFTILYTTDTNGYLQACGCTTNQVGGLAKRAGVLRRLRDRIVGEGGETLILDGGNLAPDRDIAEAVLAALRATDYQAMAVGEADVRLGAFLPDAARRHGITLTACPAPAPRRGWAGVPDAVLLTAGDGRRVGVVGLRRAVGRDASAVTEALRRLRPRADIVVAFSDMNAADEVSLFGNGGPLRGSVDILVSRGGDRPGAVAPVRVAATRNGEVGAIRVAFGTGGRFTVASAVHAVNEDAEADPEVQKIVSAYYRRQQQRLAEASAAGDPGWSSLRYEPAERCADCHARETELWRATKHARATITLRERDRLVPTCLRCHSELYRRSGLFDVRQATAWSGIECATCHGDGALHTALRDRETVQRRVSEAACRKCHDAANDPKFDYRTYVQKIRHW